MKTIGFLLMWLAGSAAAVAVAWTGVSVVDDELIDPAPANDEITAAGPVNRPTAQSTVTPPKATPTPSSAPDLDPTATLTLEDNRATATSTAAPIESPSPQPAPTSPAPAPSPTTAAPGSPAPAPTTPTTASPTSTTAPPTSTATSAQTITFNLVGGRTAISFTPAGVEVLWATPNPAFEVGIEPESPGLKVEFRADHHRSRVDAWWASGPQHEIREEHDD